MFTIKEKKDTITVTIEDGYLDKYPIDVIFHTLKIIEKNHHLGSMFFEFDSKTEKFLKNNQKALTDILKNKSESENLLNQLYFKELCSPVYMYHDMLDYVMKITEVNSKLMLSKDSVEIPKIKYMIRNPNQEEYGEKILDIKNMDELIGQFGQSFTQHGVCHFISHLNDEYKIINKTSKEPYKLSNNIKSKLFDENTQTHPILPQFEKDYYFMEQLFSHAMNKINTPEEIFTYLALKENTRINHIKPQIKKMKVS